MISTEQSPTESPDLERITFRVDPAIKINLKVLAARHGMKLNELLTKVSVDLLSANNMETNK